MSLIATTRMFKFFRISCMIFCKVTSYVAIIIYYMRMFLNNQNCIALSGERQNTETINITLCCQHWNFLLKY